MAVFNINSNLIASDTFTLDLSDIVWSPTITNTHTQPNTIVPDITWDVIPETSTRTIRYPSGAEIRYEYLYGPNYVWSDFEPEKEPEKTYLRQPTGKRLILL